MRKLVVDKKYSHQKLNKFLQDKLPTLTNNLFYKTLRKKDIKINGKRVSENVVIHVDDIIEIYISDNQLEKNIDFKIIYEDENILAVYKPSGIEVTGNDSLTSVIHNKHSNCEFLPMPCHRLDRNTMGLVLYAKNQEALDILLEKFKMHEIEKNYLALVFSIPKLMQQTLTSYLFKDSKKSIVYISDKPKKGYSKIITSYSVLEKYPNNTSLLDVQIQTGKTHQIRAHLAHIGHPIVGDGKYGNYEINKKLGYTTQQLTSYKLKFSFTSDAGILNYLRNYELSLS